ncbi:hypothetical protein AVEN_54747-1 [Araneus ventricosus]|uniref:F5/8 type C domain-containing protein n=1 Tax=Araneus ventricosus TaxID=182803 RepID=A0A4Y2MWF9_ARAVE|nr:hypothetical protein AVEN_54747-1 [Araneus ventricosus]
MEFQQSNASRPEESIMSHYFEIYRRQPSVRANWWKKTTNIGVFNGNFDDSAEVKHVFKRPFEARFVRLQPLSWETKISLRLELLGCSEALTPPTPSEEDEARGGIPTTRRHKDCGPENEEARQSENFSKLPHHLQSGHEAVPALVGQFSQCSRKILIKQLHQQISFFLL